MALGPPPPGTWRRGNEEPPPPSLDEKPLPPPREVEVLLKAPTIPFVEADRQAQESITALIFTSPVPSHPRTWLLEKVYGSIREHLPGSRIVVLADGVPGVEMGEYVQFKENVQSLGIELLEFKGWHHQTLMLRQALLTEGFITTPLVLVTEHDWAVKKLYIDWSGIAQALLDPECRFKMVHLQENQLSNDSLRRGAFGYPKLHHGVHLLPTLDFKCPCHLAATDWYRKIVAFVKAPRMLESDEITAGIHANRPTGEMACYIPMGPMGRCLHLDGRNVRNPV